MADDKGKGLEADNYSRWISNHIQIDDELRVILEEFLVGTPSCDLSRKGRDLFTYYQFSNSEEYSVLWNSLVGHISDTVVYVKYSALGEGLVNHKWLGFGDLPAKLSEAVHLYIGENRDDKLYRKHFSDLPSVNHKGTNEVRHNAAEEKRNIVSVNKLFYHLRNSLAHGCFTMYEQDDERYYVFQDESLQHVISARIVLSRSTVMKWISLFKDRESSVRIQAVQ